MSSPPFTPTCFPFNSLPTSLRLAIYELALSAALVPLTVLLRVSREALEHVRSRVYTNVRVVSMRGLARFVTSRGAERYGALARSTSIHLGGGSTIAGISPLLGRMISLTPHIDRLELVCYTLRVDPERHRLLAGLRAINPHSLAWSAPDPHHQFTIALFAQHLAPVLAGYTRLRELALGNVSFGVLNDPSRGEAGRGEVGGGAPLEAANAEGGASAASRLERSRTRTLALPDRLIGKTSAPGGRRRGGTLRSLKISRAVFLSPEQVLDWVADVEGERGKWGEAEGDAACDVLKFTSPGAADEEDDTPDDRLRVFLEDVYIESIWGPRLRMHHLVAAARARGLAPGCLTQVHVGGRHERIHGGDRMDEA